MGNMRITSSRLFWGDVLKNSFLLSQDGSAITCLLCRRTSRHPGDVKVLYCGACNWFHDSTVHAVGHYRLARAAMVMNSIPALFNLSWACYVWTWEQSFLHLLGLVSFVFGCLGVSNCWQWAKRWWVLRPFGRFI